MHEHFARDLIELATEKLRRGEIDRRSFLQALGMIAAGAALPMSIAKADDKEIVIMNFGGDAIKAWNEAWAKPFTADTGIRVVVIGGTSTAGALKAMVESGKTTVDAIDGNGFYIPILAKQNLIQKYDYSKVDKTKVRPEFVWDYGCAYYIYSTICFYNPEKTGGRTPRGYKDFLNFKEFPGKRALHKWVSASLEAILLGAGVPRENLYPLDTKRAFGLLKEHRDQFVVWGTGADSQQLFRDREVVMGNMWHTRAIQLSKETQGRMTWTWEDGVLIPAVMPVPIRNPAGPLIWDYIASTQIPERQVTLFNILGNSPANPAASAMLPPELHKLDCGNAANYPLQIPLNVDWYAENYTRVQAELLDVLSG